MKGCEGKSEKRNRVEATQKEKRWSELTVRDFDPGHDGAATERIGGPTTILALPIRVKVVAPYSKLIASFFPQTFGHCHPVIRTQLVDLGTLGGGNCESGRYPPRFLRHGQPISVLYLQSSSDIQIDFSAMVEIGTGKTRDIEHNMFSAAFYVLQEVIDKVTIPSEMRNGLDGLIREWEREHY